MGDVVYVPKDGEPKNGWSTSSGVLAEPAGSVVASIGRFSATGYGPVYKDAKAAAAALLLAAIISTGEDQPPSPPKATRSPEAAGLGAYPLGFGYNFWYHPK